MSFYIIVKKNPNGFPKRTWFESFDDGCRQAEIETIDGRVQVKRHVGLVIPDNEVIPFAMRVLSRGLDRKRPSYVYN